MSTTDYRVELDLFSGPLDLLLYLVRRNELDVANLPLAPLVAQFQDFIELLGDIDLESVGDFIVMASTLTEIKSRLVLPSETSDPGPDLEEDPRSDLIQQLLEYRKFKDAAQRLEDRAEKWQERYPRLTDDRPRSGRDASHDRIKEVELWDLVSALGRVLKLQEDSDHASILYDDTPIAVYVDQIGTRVRTQHSVLFYSLFDKLTLRSKIIGIFLAILELLRHHGFRAQQDSEHGDICILPPLEPAPEVNPAATQQAGDTPSIEPDPQAETRIEPDA